MSAVTPRNPLVSFLYSSADALAEKGLSEIAGLTETSKNVQSAEEIKQLAVSDKIQDHAKAIYYAQSTTELPTEETTSSATEDVQKILARVDAIERSWARFLKDDNRRGVDPAKFTRPLNLFKDCVNNHATKSSECETLTGFINQTYASFKRTSTEEAFCASANGYATRNNENSPSETWKAYAGGTKELSQTFQPLEEQQKAYWEMKKNLAALLREADTVPETKREQMKRAFDFMTSNFEKAYAEIRDVVFKEQRKDALLLKLAKIRLATKLVAQDSANLPPGYADNFLKRMASKLDCLTKVAVGPKFDGFNPNWKKASR